MKKLILFCILTIGLCSFSFSQPYGWQDISANIPGNPNLSDVFFVSDNEGWITSSSQAEIYHTTDGGATFEVQTTQYPTEALYMINQNEGYAGGENGRVYRTIDGGDNWTTIGSISVTLSDIDFANDTIGYACGDNGAVFSITPNGVDNFNSGLASDLSGISSPSVDNVWVCGGNKISYFDGSSFEFQSGPQGSYNAIFFINDIEGWVMGDAGLIGHTINGGNNWETQSPANPSNESLFDAFFLTTDVGWAVGANGAILSTANGGDNWTIVGSGLTTSLLRGVHFTSPNNGYVVGNGKTLLKYTEVSGIGGELVETLQFDIYPNPANNKIEIRSSEFSTKNCTIQISDLNGKNLIEKQIAGGYEKVEIDVNSLAGGVYFCTLKTGKKSSAKKLIIE